MSAVETRQMSAAETGQMSAVETLHCMGRTQPRFSISVIALTAMRLTKAAKLYTTRRDYIRANYVNIVLRQDRCIVLRQGSALSQ